MSGLDVATTVMLVAPPCLGLLWAVYEMVWVYTVKVDAETMYNYPSSPNSLKPSFPTIQSQVESMLQISDNIAAGATAFLIKEYLFMSVYIVVFAVILYFVVGLGTMISFIVGAITSIICGFIGMKVAVKANVRTAFQAWKELGLGFTVALRAGSVMGFALTSLGIINLVVLIVIYRLAAFYGTEKLDQIHLFEAIAGYGLGGSSIALFGRVGGGIYTKAADVGADLSGKNEYGMSEDDPRNPACIADNVGDNVGDVAGMGADLFGSLAEATCAALVIAATSELATSWAYLMYPVVISSTGILTGIATITFVKGVYKVNTNQDIGKALKGVLLVSTVIQAPIIAIVSYLFLPNSFSLEGIDTNWYKCMVAVLIGLVAGLIIGYVTEYYTSHSYMPVQSISNTQMVSAATGIISGMALGYYSTIVPIFCLAATVCVAHLMCGMYGFALAALGMLSTLSMGLAIDAYGPVSDNAGGIVEMAGLGDDVRKRTDALDAAGNTTAAIGKGFAIGSAALVSLSLFGAFTVRANVSMVDALDTWTFTGLLFGAMIPYAFCAMTMKSVGVAADDMVKECKKQFPKIISEGAEPDYTKCIGISTAASLREMILPGALVILSPLLAAGAFGKNATAGLLIGALLSGIQLAISASNSGGAWDNAKKFIESGALGEGHKKGSATHKNSVIGDTVGDPLKDTSGPSLNILIKLSAIVSLVFADYIASHLSNANGGPWWL